VATSIELLIAYNPRAICAVFAGVVLLVAGVGKIATVKEFRKLLVAFGLLPRSLVPLFAWLLPPAEVLVGIALLTDAFQPIPAFAAALLFSGFAGAIAINLLRGRRELACGCFGTASKQISFHLVARNLALAGLAICSANIYQGLSLMLFAPYVGSVLSRLVGRVRRQGGGDFAGADAR
jgi:uncharacterized membrane protein YphA (DoxX/SURF4 family)